MAITVPQHVQPRTSVAQSDGPAGAPVWRDHRARAHSSARASAKSVHSGCDVQDTARRTQRCTLAAAKLMANVVSLRMPHVT